MGPITGRFAPLPTPLTDDASSVSEIRLARLVHWMRDRAVQAVLVAGEIGEFATLGSGERKQLIEIVVRESKAAIEVIVNVTAGSTMMALDLAQHAYRHGARAVVAAPPPWYKLTDDEVFSYYRLLQAHGNLPVLAADPYGRISDSLAARIAELPAVRLMSEDSTFDHWSLEQAVCDPMLALAPGVEGEPAEGLAELARLYGAVRIAKPLFSVRELDLGPLRAPLQEPEPAVVDVLRALRPQLDE